MQSVPSPPPPFRPLRGGGTLMADCEDVYCLVTVIISLLTENQRIPRGTCHS